MKISLKTHFRLARISNLPTAWSNVLCAYLIVGGSELGALIGAIVAVSFFYIGGMYLNDWRDADHDSEYQPERPIPSQKISRKVVLCYAAVYFIAALGIGLAIEPASLLWSLALIVCIAVYDLDHKNNAMSPWVMAACRGLIYPWAASLASQELSMELWIAGLAVYVYTLGLTYAARGVGKVVLSKLALLLCLFLPAILWGSQLSENPLWLRFFGMTVFLAWTAYCISGWWSKSSMKWPSIGNLIAGFCFVDLLALSISTPISVATLLLIALLFISTIKFQTIISGT